MAIKKRKLNYKRFMIFVLFIYIIFYLGIDFFAMKISNIYIEGNEYLSDQEVIELAKISNYPFALKTVSSFLEKKIEKSELILEAKVSKRRFSEIYIEIIENRPLFYNQNKKETIMTKGVNAEINFDVPILVNSVPEVIYDKLIIKIKEVENDVLMKISEIKYDPNDVDDERLLFHMTDGVYVYVTLYKLEVINEYLDISKKIDNKKGILFLDYGNSFTILED